MLRRFSTRTALLATLISGLAGAAAGQDLSNLEGSWVTAPASAASDAADAADAALTVEVEGRLVLEGQWLRLEIRAFDGRGRGKEETAFLATDGGQVSAYVFSSENTEPTRLAGAWSEDGSLSLSDAAGNGFRWTPDGACEARLRRDDQAAHEAWRSIERRLLSLTTECGAEAQPQLAEARPENGGAAPAEAGPDGRPVGARPERSEAAASTSETPGVLAEVDVSSLPTAKPATSAGEPASLVLVAGQGRPYDEAQKGVERIMGFLAANGVAVEGPTDEIVLLQVSENSVPYLLRQARERNAAGLLFVFAQFGHRERIEATAYNLDGLVLWTERVVGGTALRDRKVMNPRLVGRMEKKLQAHLGTPGLPVADG